MFPIYIAHLGGIKQYKSMVSFRDFLYYHAIYHPSLPNTLWGSVFGGPPNTSFLDAEIGSPTTDPHKVFGEFWKTRVKGTRMSMVLSKRIILGAGWTNPFEKY